MSRYYELFHPIAEHAVLGGTTRLEMGMNADQLAGIVSPLVLLDMKRPIGRLQSDVRSWLLNGFGKPCSGIDYPQEVTLFESGVGHRTIHEVSLLGVTVGDYWVDTFAVLPETLSAARIGRIVNQSELGRHYNNVSPNLGYSLSEQLSRLALAEFCFRSTHNQYND